MAAVRAPTWSSTSSAPTRPWRAGGSALVPGGRLVVVGGARGSMVVGKGLALPLGWQVSAPFWGAREDLVAVIDLAEQGLLAPVVEVVPFATWPRPTSGCTTAP